MLRGVKFIFDFPVTGHFYTDNPKELDQKK